MIEPQNLATYILPGSVAFATAVALWPRKETADDKPVSLEVHFLDGFDERDKRSQSDVSESLENTQDAISSVDDQIISDDVPAVEPQELEMEDEVEQMDIIDENSNAEERLAEIVTDDEPTYFGTEPLTEVQRLAAREKWAAQTAEETQIITEDSIVDGKPWEMATYTSEIVTELMENNKPQNADLQEDIKHSIPVTEMISQFAIEPTPEIDELLVTAFGIDEFLRLPILHALTKSGYPANVAIYRRVVDENRSIEEVWTAIEGLQKHECTEPLDQLLSYPSPLPAKALLALLPCASRDDYATYLSARVNAESMHEILETLEPMLAL